MNWDYMGMHGYYGGGFMWLWFFIIILVVALVLVPFFKNSTTQARPKESALEILEKRFARGEINEDEYKRMKQTLEND
ncbi:SHOCT domain-containing protein [Thiomicrorhabdus sp.]|uniref:SHOCT domain-containing protein n=1 Tax=Thiomicrorhabdus sp. TaxID=2039724 RepID=UPI0035670E4B